MQLTGIEIAVALAVVSAAGVVRGFSGFGAGLVMVPALTLLVGPAWAVPVVVLIEAAAAIQLVPTAWRDVRWRTVLPLGIAAALTIPLGSRALAALDAELTRRAISAIVLVMVAVLWTGWRSRRTPGLPAMAATGAVSGLLTGFAGIGGPPVIVFYLAGRDGAPGVRAGLICYFAITQWVALSAFGFNGLLVRDVWIGAVVLLPAFLIGAWGGTRLFGRIDEVVFRRVVFLFLATTALIGLL